MNSYNWLVIKFCCHLNKIIAINRMWWLSTWFMCIKFANVFLFFSFHYHESFGHTTNVWIGLQNDDYEKWLNGRPVSYSNWSPFDTINVSFKNYFLSVSLARDLIWSLFTEVLFLLVCCQYIFNNVISCNFHAFHRCNYSSQYLFILWVIKWFVNKFIKCK